jgi:hypothetical protein
MYNSRKPKERDRGEKIAVVQGLPHYQATSDMKMKPGKTMGA